MAKNVKNAVIYLVVYGLALWIGFRAGEISNRMRKLEKIASKPKTFFIIEKQERGNYTSVAFDEVDGNSPIIRFLQNQKLKPLLKLRDLQIYTQDGDRIY